MKKQTAVAYAVALALHAGAFGIAAAGGSKQDGKAAERRHSMKGERIDAMAERLKLSADQKKTVAAILSEKSEKMKALHEEFAAKRMSLSDEYEGRLTGALTDRQKTEYARMKAEAEKRREEFRNRRKDRDEKQKRG